MSAAKANTFVPNDSAVLDAVEYSCGGGAPLYMNAITIIEEGKTHIKSDIKSIEDFYNTEGNYIHTEIRHSYANKSKMLMTEEGNSLKEELQEPSTILISPDHANNFKLKNMTQEEQTQVKEHVLAYVEMVKKIDLRRGNE
ncbi:hypothetical protein [Paenibacillus sp. YIM B09110]|uniref:hypothetical protein n=1 Tax=Paenibacillus sp. YIM B09110 TaxID=3126102 RepID=UPI00301BD8A0